MVHGEQEPMKMAGGEGEPNETTTTRHDTTRTLLCGRLLSRGGGLTGSLFSSLARRHRGRPPRSSQQSSGVESGWSRRMRTTCRPNHVSHRSAHLSLSTRAARLSIAWPAAAAAARSLPLQFLTPTPPSTPHLTLAGTAHPRPSGPALASIPLNRLLARRRPSARPSVCSARPSR